MTRDFVRYCESHLCIRIRAEWQPSFYYMKSMNISRFLREKSISSSIHQAACTLRIPCKNGIQIKWHRKNSMHLDAAIVGNGMTG